MGAGPAQRQRRRSATTACRAATRPRRRFAPGICATRRRLHRRHLGRRRHAGAAAGGVRARRQTAGRAAARRAEPPSSPIRKEPRPRRVSPSNSATARGPESSARSPTAAPAAAHPAPRPRMPATRQPPGSKSRSAGRGLRAAPVAALTVGGNLDAGASALGVHNRDAATGGLALHAGGSVAGNALRLSAPPGRRSTARWSPATQLAALAADRFFARWFGMDRAAWSAQPAATPTDCAGTAPPRSPPPSRRAAA